jgi:hypothetical protein
LDSTSRIVDALTLLSLVGLSFLLEFDTITRFMNDVLVEYNIDTRKILVGLAILAVVIAVSILLVLSKSNKYTARIRAFVLEVYQGVSSIRKLEKLPGFLISSILLWVVYYLMSYIIVFSLEETSFLSISAGFMLLVTGGIALALPVQGGIGTYHTMVTAMLMIYGIDKTTGLFLATLLHTSQIVAVAIFGGIALLLSFLISRARGQ